MMRFVGAVTLLALLATLAAKLLVEITFGQTPAPRLYVVGDSEAAIEARRILGKAVWQFEDRACFDLAEQKDADLVLKVEQREVSPSAVNAMLGMTSTTVVTGQMADRWGKSVWETSRPGAAGFVHDGSGAGAMNLLRSLWKSQGCSKDGRR